MIRLATTDDAAVIAQIYNHYIASTTVTFEENALAEAEMAERVTSTLGSELPWLVFENDGVVLGYAYASPWSGRCAYRYSAEITVYLDPNAVGQGVGTTLYEALLRELKQRDYRTVIGGIALPNEASIALHEKFGMKKVGHFEEVGFKFDRWIDVGYWQGKLDAE